MLSNGRKLLQLDPGQTRTIFEVLRFGLVGGLSTTCSIAVALGAVLCGFTQDSRIAIAAAMTIGVAISYAGHYGFTFRSNEPHIRTAPRFLITQVLVLVFVLALTHVAQQYLRLNHLVITGLTAVIWPASNYFLSKFLVFTSAPDKKA